MSLLNVAKESVPLFSVAVTADFDVSGSPSAVSLTIAGKFEAREEVLVMDIVASTFTLSLDRELLSSVSGTNAIGGAVLRSGSVPGEGFGSICIGSRANTDKEASDSASVCSYLTMGRPALLLEGNMRQRSPQDELLM